MTILVVEDDPVSQRLLEMTLRRRNFQVASVTNAPAAFEWLKQESAVELIITDLNLGGMSGLQLFTALHADPRWRNLPVILCTAVADHDTVVEAVRRGFRHFVVKPIRPAYLLEKVSEILAQQVPVVEPRFDAMARLQLSEAEYRTLVETTLDHLAALAERLGAVREAGDYVEAILVARRFREPAELLGAERSLAALATLDEAANAWQRDRALALISQEIATLQEALSGVARPVSPVKAKTAVASSAAPQGEP